MLVQQIKLCDVFEGLPKGQEAFLTCYVSENSPEINANKRKPSMMICPGGGYGFTSDREAEPIAIAFMARGYNAFVLRYSVAPSRYPQQLLEVSAAVSYIRSKADEWPIDVNQIAVCGFSAGGHLAGHLGVAWQEPFITQTLGIEQGSNQPNQVILCYPVITSGEYAHKGSFQNLLGENPSETLLEHVSLEKRVTSMMPPTFLWHTGEDCGVPLENSFLMAMALRKQGCAFEAHFYEKGGHGLSLANELTAKHGDMAQIMPQVATWVNLVIGWLDQHN